jgi:hypothetical protein
MIENSPTLGSIETSLRKKRQLAEESLEFNIKSDPMFGKLFPEYVTRYHEELRLAAATTATPSITPHHRLVSSSAAAARGAAVVAADGFPQALMAALAGIAAILSIVAAVRFF